MQVTALWHEELTYKGVKLLLSFSNHNYEPSPNTNALFFSWRVPVRYFWGVPPQNNSNPS